MCRKRETVPVVFRSVLCTSFQVVSLVFPFFLEKEVPDAVGRGTEHMAGALQG